MQLKELQELKEKQKVKITLHDKKIFHGEVINIFDYKLILDIGVFYRAVLPIKEIEEIELTE